MSVIIEGVRPNLDGVCQGIRGLSVLRNQLNWIKIASQTFCKRVTLQLFPKILNALTSSYQSVVELSFILKVVV
jgi:hypothetical protein